MPNAMTVRLRFASLVLLALAGTLLGHAIEYGLVSGWRGVALGLAGPLHSYMIPAAAILVVASFVLALRITALVRAARSQYAALWRRLHSGVRPSDAREAERASAARHGFDPHPLGLALTIATAQVVLYLIQENAEAAIAGAPAPGLAALTGTHWAAALVQFAVATWLTIGWLLLRRVVRRRTAPLATLAAAIRAILSARRTREATFLEPGAAVISFRRSPRAARAPPRLITV